jgi:hypothetical protein
MCTIFLLRNRRKNHAYDSGCRSFTLRASNKGKLTGQKPPLQPKHVWAIRTRLQLAEAKRDLALFSLAVDSKLRDVIS